MEAPRPEPDLCQHLVSDARHVTGIVGMPIVKTQPNSQGAGFALDVAPAKDEYFPLSFAPSSAPRNSGCLVHERG